MKFIISFIIAALFYQTTIYFAQMIKKSNSNLVSEREIFFDEKTKVRYSNLVTVKFNENIIDIEKGSSKIDKSKISKREVKNYFAEIQKKYGKFEIFKLIPSATSEDTIVINKRTGRTMPVPNWSQVFQLRFKNLVPIDSIITNLLALSSIEYAEEPVQSYCTIEPNDEKYVNGNNWAFKSIRAPDSWNITKGSSEITIAILDSFSDSIKRDLHEDLIGKVDYIYKIYGNNSCNHGIFVAGIAGASTNNKIGIASLGWNLRLRLFDSSYNTRSILEAINNDVDVINFSWVRRVDLHQTRDAIKTALSKGIVCVAAAGNDYFDVPDTLYPAAYNFGKLGQVISVSGTEWNGYEEKFIEGWNYSPGTNPNVDPTSSYIDVAAPGKDIELLDDNLCTGYKNGRGTSLSAAFVSALVGLMFSVDSTLTVNEVYNLIRTNTDKVGQFTYDDNGWNQYLGYGRINAFKTLEAVKNLTDLKRYVHIENFINYILGQNYPNPFNPSTTIKYQVPGNVKSEKANNETFIRLNVFDILGREVTTLVSEKQKPGNYEVEWDATDVPSGVYFYQLTADDFVETRKMILLK